MVASQSALLLKKVSLRRRLVGLARSAFWTLMVLTGIYAVLLVLSLVSVVSVPFDWPTLLIPPAAALLFGLIVHHRPTAREAARLVDLRMATKDLFLTVAMIDKAPGAYKPLVLKEAENRATGIRARTVVPFEPWQKTAGAVLTMGVLAVAIGLDPFDPFGLNAEREKEEERRAVLTDQKKQVADRKKQLKQGRPDAEHSPRVDRAIEELKLQFTRTKPNEKAKNFSKLREEQRKLDALWNQAKRTENLSKALSKERTARHFGASDAKKSQKWKEDLQSGNGKSLNQQLEEIRELAQKLQDSEDPREKQKLRNEMKQKLKEVADFANSKVGSSQLQRVLNGAIEQLDMSAMQGLESEALDALQESLELSQMEIEQIAQMMRDQAALAEALEALNQAKARNELQPLDGAQCAGCGAMGDFAGLFGDMLSQCQGGGMGGPGQGKGGVAPEDSDQQIGFKSTKHKTYLTEGRSLLEWEDRGLTEQGKAIKDYRRSVEGIKQRVSEAINTEEVPPGYRDAIRQYFDKYLDEKSKAAEVVAPKALETE